MLKFAVNTVPFLVRWSVEEGKWHVWFTGNAGEKVGLIKVIGKWIR